MPELKIQLTIHADPKEVYRLLADIPNSAAIMRSIKRVQVMKGEPPESGSQWKETRKGFIGEFTKLSEVVRSTPGTSYTVKSSLNGCETLTEITVEEVEMGCLLSFSLTSKPESFFSKWLYGVFGPIIRHTTVKSIKADLDDLRSHAEAYRN